MNKIILFTVLALLCSCQSQQTQNEKKLSDSDKDSDSFMIVDCLLPGQLRKLGQQASYLTARRPVKTSASDCEIRGGEYVAFDRANYSTALKIWLPKASEGDADAQAYVGEIYEKGLGLKPDYEVALLWYKKAAAQGNTRAQLSLGYLYEKGLGVKVDKNEAMRWYRKASGLSAQKMDYSYTIKTDTVDDNHELKLLKAELATSRNNSKLLEEKLQKTEQQKLLNQQKLQLSKAELKKARQVLKTKSASSTKIDNSQIAALIKSKQAEILQQQKLNKQLQQQHLQQLKKLNDKLSETQKRSKQLVDDLQKNKSQQNKQQIELLKLQEKLVKTEKQLLNVRDQYSKIDNLANDQELNQPQQLKLQIEMEKYQVEAIQGQLASIKKEKQQQQQLIQKLHSSDQQYKQKIDKLNQQLSQNNISAKKLKELKQSLFTQKQEQQKALQIAQNYKQELQQLSKQHQTKEELYQIKLAKIESEKENFENLYSRTFQQSQTERQKLEQVILSKKKQWDEQQKTINTLLKEKQQLTNDLLALKQNTTKRGSAEAPVIEILDPAFVQVRGVPTVSMRSLVKQRQITGKITSADEIFLLSINDQPTSIDENGLFKKNIKLLQTETPVNVSVVDKKGKKSAVNFVISMSSAKKVAENRLNKPKKDRDEELINSIDFGKYHALIIGNNKYQKVPSLDTPVNDATDVAKVLSEKYGFQTQLLLNATRYEILSVLNKYRSSLNKDDNLLVYYAGHGELDKVNMRGHWLPVDADPDNTANWISTVALTDIFNAMSVNHLMVVADSCYSGAMTRAALVRLDAGKTNNEKAQWLKAMLKARSRTILASGGLKPVLDGGGGNHSVFAKAFIDSLKYNNNLLEGQSLHREIATKIVAVANKYGVEQVPEYAPMRHAGHEAGEFFFVPR